MWPVLRNANRGSRWHFLRRAACFRVVPPNRCETTRRRVCNINTVRGFCGFEAGQTLYWGYEQGPLCGCEVSTGTFLPPHLLCTSTVFVPAAPLSPHRRAGVHYGRHRHTTPRYMTCNAHAYTKGIHETGWDHEPRMFHLGQCETC